MNLSTILQSELFSRFVEFKSYAKKQFGTYLKILRSDSGGEYTSNQFKKFTTSTGIVHQFTCPHIPPQNGTLLRETHTPN